MRTADSSEQLATLQRNTKWRGKNAMNGGKRSSLTFLCQPLPQPLASSPVAPLHFQVLAAMLPFTCHFCLGDGHPPSRHPLGLSEVLLPRGGGGGVSGPPSGGDAIPVPSVPVASLGPVLLLHGVHGA